MFKVYVAGTFVDMPTDSQHSGAGVSNLLVMDSDLFAQKVFCFPSVLLPAAPVFHHVDNVFDLVCHIFMHFEVN